MNQRTVRNAAKEQTGERAVLLAVLFLLSGAAALAYQVLWIRGLSLVVGNTAQAAAVAIAIFFTGLAFGGWFWGRRTPEMTRPLQLFGLLEIGVAVTAVGYLYLQHIIALLPAALHPLSGAPPALDLVAKIFTACVVLLPPAFLMGGTFPAMAEHVLRSGGRLGQKASRLYSVNTVGAALGALGASFILPPVVGFHTTYLIAIAIDFAVGIGALILARGSMPQPLQQQRRPPKRPVRIPRTIGLIWAIAALSGAATLAVEVLWTRLFAQVLQNSVQTYAVVLATFLLALAFGAIVASHLARIRRIPAATVLVAVLLASTLAILVSGPLFVSVTEGVQTLGRHLAFGEYLWRVTTASIIVIFLPGLVIGITLPFLLRMLENDMRSPGELVGRLIAINTIGAIGGALIAGFVLLPWLGSARALLLVAGIYPLLAAAVLFTNELMPRAPIKASLAGFVGIALFFGAGALPENQLDPASMLGRNEFLVAAREGPAANVAVVAREDALSLRVNRTYTLGGTASYFAEQDQAILPLLLHPEPREVFLLGMGTGITAGAALQPFVHEVVACELISDVVALAAKYFAPWTRGLFEDQRATIIADDGRSCLQRSDRRYDLIVSDLFVPWQAGTGSLYTVEFYQLARQRLHPSGLFVQWLPLYQMTRPDLDLVAATMAAAFEDVIVLRGDFFSRRSIIGLVGRADGPLTLDPVAIARQGTRMDEVSMRTDTDYLSILARMYVGNLTSSGILQGTEVITDRSGLIELRAPRSQRNVAAGFENFVVGAEREQFYRELRDALPPEQDPSLARLDTAALDAVYAGHMLSQAAYLAAINDSRAAQMTRSATALLPESSRHVRSPARAFLAPLDSP